MDMDIGISIVSGLIFILCLLWAQKQHNLQKGRFQKVVRFSGDFEKLSLHLHELLTENHYYIHSYRYETVYRQGKGILVTARYLKFSKVPGGILVEAFILDKSAEVGLVGFLGMAAKRPLKKMVEKLIAHIEAYEKENPH